MQIIAGYFFVRYLIFYCVIKDQYAVLHISETDNDYCCGFTNWLTELFDQHSQYMCLHCTLSCLFNSGSDPDLCPLSAEESSISSFSAHFQLKY